jgi:predicted branched-subunit amino acid permease
MGTLLGHQLGALVTRPERFALDFAFVAVFTALTVSMWRGKSDLLPWIVAAVLAIAAQRGLPGKWYILIGGLGGALVSVLQHTSNWKYNTSRAKRSNPLSGEKHP